MIFCLLHGALGGLYFFIEDKPEDAESHFLGLSQSPFINNSANFTGGAIFTNSPNAVGVCINCSTLRVESTPTPEKPLKRVIKIKKEYTKGILDNTDACDLCWVRNVAGKQEGGEHVATTATTTRLCNVASHECLSGDGLLTLSNHSSGEVLQDINITLLDVFSKPALGQPIMRLEIKADMTDVSLSGQLSADFAHATSLAYIRAEGLVNSRFNLTLSFSPNILSNVDLEVELRGCLAGEIEDADYRCCPTCGTNLYSFHPNQTCRP